VKKLKNPKKRKKVKKKIILKKVVVEFEFKESKKNQQL
jgi:ribosomal protein L5